MQQPQLTITTRNSLIRRLLILSLTSGVVVASFTIIHMVLLLVRNPGNHYHLTVETLSHFPKSLHDILLLPRPCIRIDTSEQFPAWRPCQVRSISGQ
jgi:hypothetical protein